MKKIWTPTGRRMLEVWKDEGKEDSDRRREWDRRRREVGDIMNEEDVMETSIMHLCLPDYEKKEKDTVIVRMFIECIECLRGRNRILSYTPLPQLPFPDCNREDVNDVTSS